jgi:hypothetical protein
MALTGEVEGEVLERASRFIGVAAENVGTNEPLDKVVAAFRVVDRLQLHFEGDACVTEFVCIAAALVNLLVTAIEHIARHGFHGPLEETIRLFLSLTAESQCKSLVETRAKLPTAQNTERPPQY